MPKKKRVGIINSGGDCPGLNRVIDSVVRGLDDSYEILGFIKGFEGLLDNKYIVLDRNMTAEHRWQGGTFLKSVNHGRFPGKIHDGMAREDLDIIKKTKTNYDKLGLDGLIVLGGDGTLTIASNLQKYGFRFVGIPKSIDNDLSGTDFTFGFFSAVEVGKGALTSLHSTAFSHDRVLVVELMGREVGWITLYSGLAASCEMIFVPEIDFSFKGVVEHLRYRRKIGKSYAVIAIAEGCVPKDYFRVVDEIGNNAAEGRLGGISGHMANYINQNSDFEARNMALSYLQRSGLPSGYDSLLAMQYGTYAASLYKKGRFGYMATLKEGIFGEIRIDRAISKLKKVDPRSQIIKLAKDNGVYFGD